MVPGGFIRFVHSGKLEFQHVPLGGADIGSGPVPRVEVDKADCSGRPTDGQSRFRGLCGIRIGNRSIKLGPRDNTRCSHVFSSVLGIIKGKDPMEPRVPDVMIKDIAVLVPGLPLAP